MEDIVTVPDEHSARHITLVCAVAGSILRIEHQRAASRYRGTALGPNAVDLVPGETVGIPLLLGDWLFDLNVTHLREPDGAHHVSLTSKESIEASTLASLELILHDAAGHRLESATFQHDTCRLTTVLQSARYQLTLVDRRAHDVVATISVETPHAASGFHETTRP